MNAVQDLLLSSLKEILGAITAAAVLYIRYWMQSRVATSACEKQEQEGLPNEERHGRAASEIKERLPIGIRPLTDAGVDSLVKRSVSKARKNVSSRPPPIPKDAN